MQEKFLAGFYCGAFVAGKRQAKKFAYENGN